MTAATGRSDYDQTVKLSSLQPGEPIFLIRGGDAVAGDAVRAWAGLAHRLGAPAEALELALQQADRLDAWPGKKAPDGPELSEQSRKQLRYEHSRRSWRARATVPTDAALLASQLARDQVVGQLRVVVSTLTDALLSEEDINPALTQLYALVGRDFGELQAELAQLHRGPETVA